MAQIKYLDSRRIMGESDGTDIAPTFEDDFSSDNWTDSDSAKMGVQSGYLYAYGQRDGTNDSSSRSLGTTLNGDFVFRTKVDITSWSAGSVGYGKGVIIGLSNQSNTASDSTAQDSISISISARQTNGDGFYATWSDNQGMGAGGSTRIGSLAISTGIRYFEIIKNGTTVTYNIYSDNLYSTLVATASQTSVTATGFTYAVVRNENGTASTQSGYVEADIDDWEVFAGVTSVTTGKPKQPLSLSGCKAYYNFEQTSGSLTNIATTANGFSDGLGSSADGTVQNITRNATGKLGSYAYTFNGTTSSSKVTLGSSYSQFVFLRSADSTVSVWLKKAETSTTSFRTIFAEHYGAGGQSGIRIGVSNNKFNIVVYNSGSSVVVSTTDFNYPQNTDWHHIVIKFDYTNSLMTVYVDGSSLGTKALGSTSSGNSSLYASLGDDQGGDGNWYGDMDDLALFSKALTSSEISALYNGGTGVAVNDSSLQVKPETNSIFVETDTASRWWFDGTYWNMQPAFQDDFSSDNWSDSTSYMGVSNGTLNITTRGATTNDSTSYDLQNYLGVNADNEKWVLRFKMKFNTSFFGDGAGGTILWIGLSDKNNTAGARTTTQDFIGISTVYISTGIQFSSSDFNNSLLGWSTGQGTEQDQNVALSASQYYYIEIKRTSATTYETGIYSDSNYLNALHTYTSGSTSSSVTNLRYIVCRNYDQQTLANSCSVTIDDMYFWNGVTSVQQ